MNRTLLTRELARVVSGSALLLAAQDAERAEIMAAEFAVSLVDHLERARPAARVEDLRLVIADALAKPDLLRGSLAATIREQGLRHDPGVLLAVAANLATVVARHQPGVTNAR